MLLQDEVQEERSTVVDQLKEFIDNNINKEITRKDAWGCRAFEPGYLNRLFKKKPGFPG